MLTVTLNLCVFLISVSSLLMNFDFSEVTHQVCYTSKTCAMTTKVHTRVLQKTTSVETVSKYM